MTTERSYNFDGNPFISRAIMIDSDCVCFFVRHPKLRAAASYAEDSESKLDSEVCAMPGPAARGIKKVALVSDE